MVDRREVQEAISAADDALFYLRRAADCLRGARGWGMWDMLGGGFLSTMMKHGKMNKAEVELENARDALQRFSRELRDVGGLYDVRLHLDDFLRFADYFFDGMIADWMVQSRIRDAQRQVDDAIARVEQIRSELTNML